MASGKRQAFFGIKVKADLEPEDVVNLLVLLRDFFRIRLGRAYQADAQRQRVLVLVRERYEVRIAQHAVSLY